MEVAEMTPVMSSIKLSNIIFATDFSNASESALPFVAVIARRYKSKAYLAHVVTTEPYPGMVPEAVPDLMQEAKRGAERQLEVLANSKPFDGIRSEVLVGQGELCGTLMRWIRDHEINLLVIGTHGRRGLKRFLLGSLAEEIFRNSPIPVLTVGPHVRIRTQGETSFRHILFPTALSEKSRLVAFYAVSLATEYSARLTVLHVLPRPKINKPHPRLLNVEMKQTMGDLIPEGKCSGEIDTLVEYGDPADTILSIARTANTDLIVMGVRQADALVTHMEENIAYRVVTEADCPVLTVR